MSFVIETTSGSVRGQTAISCTDEEYYSFEGIPYGKAPIGNLRFKDPLPVPRWNEVLQCRPSKPCPQQETLSKRYVGQEDCLTINVFTKQIKPRTCFRPVMVYIYGGGFMRGTASPDLYGPDYLVQQDVVVVTFNYRVGAFGFLSLSEPELNVPGNAGMKDQVMALRWVQNNIVQFGGDPGNVTLFGESAGACSVHMHMLSPMSEGLFHKVILQSGSAFNHRSVSPRHRSLTLARRFGWSEELGGDVALQLLQQAAPERIVEEQQDLLTPEERKVYTLFPFGPVVEPYVGEQCFLPATPLELATKREPGWGWGLRLPMIIGITSHEALLLYKETIGNPSILSSLGDFSCVVPQEFGLDSSDQAAVQAGADIKRHYFGNSEPTLENIHIYIKMLSDKLFVHATLRTARLHEGPVYMYRFAIDARNNLFKKAMCGDVPGACHADDIYYIFKCRPARCFHEGTVERSATDKLVQAWTTFARDSAPRAAHSSWQAPDWPPIHTTRDNSSESQSTVYMDFENERVTVKQNLGGDDMDVWDGLYRRHVPGYQ